MKRKSFISIIVISNICFIVLHIHKYNAITELMYTKQQYEKEFTLLTEHELKLKQELAGLQDKKIVMHYAQKYLNLYPITLGQIRKP